MGAALGSTLLVNASDVVVTIAIALMFVASVVAERYEIRRLRAGFAPVMAFVSGASSGFSGTSGPLKGAAIRNLDLDRRHFVGAASLASFAGGRHQNGDLRRCRTAGSRVDLLAVAALPLMALGTWDRFDDQPSGR